MGKLVGSEFVDEYRLMVFPTVLGQRKRLFEGLSTAEDLRLTDTRPAGDAVILTYVPSGDGVG